MHEIEKWIDYIYHKRAFKLDRNSVKSFLEEEIRKSPLEDPQNTMAVLSGVVYQNLMYEDLFLLVLIEYEKELREKEEREKCVISNKCRECDNIAYYRGNDKIAVCLHDSFRPQAPLITEDLKCPKEVEE